MEVDEVYEHFSKKSNEELLSTVLIKRDSFPHQSITIAETILKERGINFTSTPSNDSDSPPRTTSLPMIIGILLISSFFILRKFTLQNPDSVLITNFAIFLSVRVIVTMWITGLANDYKLNKSQWQIFGFLFPAITLIAMNIAINKQVDDYVVTSDTSVIEEQTNDDIPVDDHILSSCPACNFQLKANEASCPDCGLSLR